MISSDESDNSEVPHRVVEEDRDGEEEDRKARRVTGKSRGSSLTPSDSELSTDDDKGWEDWDEDQRRALGKSHQRTLGSLEEGSQCSRSQCSIGPSTVDPRGQILPSDLKLSHQEEEAKKRKHLKDVPLKKNKKFFTRGCILVGIIGLASVIGAIAITFILPISSPGAYVLPILSDTATSGQNDEVIAYSVQEGDVDVEQKPDDNRETTLLVESMSTEGDTLVHVQTPDAIPVQAQAVQVHTPEHTIVEVESPPDNSTIQVQSLHLNNQNITNNNENGNDNDLGAVSRFFQKVTSFVGIRDGNKLKNSDAAQTKTDIIVPEYVVKDLIGLTLPNYESLYSHTAEPVVNVQPVLWITPRSGSKTLKEILTYCFRLILSCDAALSHEDSSTLEIFSTADNSGHFVNCNTETMEGLSRAQNIGVVDSELVHVIATPYVSEASALFAHKARTGRIFAILRHPVDQSHSDYLLRKQLPPGHPDSVPAELTFAQFVESELLVTNPLTKALLNITDGTLVTRGHTYMAKKIMEERVLVGLLEEFDESVDRFKKYFGWTLQDSICINNFETTRDHRQDHLQLQESSNEWKILSDRNYADMELYEFAKVVFQNQFGFTNV